MDLSYKKLTNSSGEVHYYELRARLKSGGREAKATAFAAGEQVADAQLTPIENF